MSNRSVSTLLLLLICLLTLWRGGRALFDVWGFLRLDTQVECEVKNYSVKELSRSKYALQATCVYPFAEKEWTKSVLLPPPYFPNRYAAEEAVGAKQLTKTKLWIDSSHPSHVALERKFPWRSCLYAAVCLGILLYFIYITQVFGKEHKNNANTKL
jgi:hypothetical protein